MTPLTFIAIALAGLVIGILSGMFGIGGGAVTIPLLNLVFRLPILGATATSLFVIAPTSLSGAYRHLKQGTAVAKAALQIGAAGAVTSVLSAALSDSLPDIVILLAAATIIVYSAATMIREALKKPLDEEGHTSANRFKSPRSELVARICLGLFAGSIAGVVGVGGGFIIIPFSVAYFGYTFKQASGTSLLAIACIALPGIITHAVLGHIWYLYGVAIIIGSIPGANIGARIIRRVPEKAARFAFGGLLIISGVMLVVNQVFLGA
jgi:uncharacterized membrane protein YfcA